MLYLIGQILIWLALTFGFAALAGWAYAARRAAPARAQLRRERERLVRDLAVLAAGEAQREDAPADLGESLTRVREGRIAELERALEAARERADDAAAEAEELRRRLERHEVDAAELMRLRAFAAEREAQRAHAIDAEATPVAVEAEEEGGALQAWRLRYFEQRVRYLESLARTAAPAPSERDAGPAQPLAEWRAREAEARAAHLTQALRALSASAPAAQTAPVDAETGVDELLRWRRLYLERRVAHLQAQAGAGAEAVPTAAMPAVAAESAPDPDRWKWRARYLEARVRHLEQRAAAAPASAAAPAVQPAEPAEETEPAPPPRPERAGVKPPVLASARNGAPDDLTLIEGVSLLQQSTLNALGVFHFDQIAAWTPDHVAWVDRYLRLRGRIDEEEWVEQARELTRGIGAPRRALQEA